LKREFRLVIIDIVATGAINWYYLCQATSKRRFAAAGVTQLNCGQL